MEGTGDRGGNRATRGLRRSAPWLVSPSPRTHTPHGELRLPVPRRATSTLPTGNPMPQPLTTKTLYGTRPYPGPHGYAVCNPIMEMGAGGGVAHGVYSVQKTLYFKLMWNCLHPFQYFAGKHTWVASLTLEPAGGTSTKLPTFGLENVWV